MKSERDLWSGRFRKTLSEGARSFSSSPEDAVLLKYDILGSLAHLHSLHRAGIIGREERMEMERGLTAIYSEYKEHPEALLRGREDLHMAVEMELTSRTAAGARLHTGRSRNDQIATDLRLYTREQLVIIASRLAELLRTLKRLARSVMGVTVPSYTHLQRAQPVYLSHLMLSHFWRLASDMTRIIDAFSLLNISPLGAGAIAGNGIGLDTRIASDALGFSRPFLNSIEATEGRDFCADAAYVCSMLCAHISSQAEEIILWSTHEFSFIELPDEFSTGSSLMPHKKNPDIAELLRARYSTVLSSLFAILVIIKALPSGYSRDLQEVKRHLFSAIEITSSSLKVHNGMLSSMHFSEENMRAASRDALTYSVEAVHELVRRGMPFREAHRLVGEAVAESAESGENFLSVLAGRFPDVPFPSSPEEDIELRSSGGGGSSEDVLHQLSEADRRVSEFEAWIAARRKEIARVERNLLKRNMARNVSK